MFASAKVTDPETVNLLSWLTSDKFLQEQEKVKAATDPDHKRIAKERMPCITPSGVFSQRGKNYLLRHTGLIAIDIDLKDNLHISNYADLKKELCRVLNIAYCGLSVSGTGYWALIPVAYPERHELHFEFIRQYFENKGLKIDKACKDVARLRFYSYNPDAYFNHAAKPLQSFYRPPEVKPRKPYQPKFEGQGKPVWEQYNESKDFIEVLENHSWKVESMNGNKTYFTRPGKQSGISAEYDSGKNVFYVFTENGGPFEPNTGYNPFQVFAKLDHKGDFGAAAKALMPERLNRTQSKPSKRSVQQSAKVTLTQKQKPVIEAVKGKEAIIKPDKILQISAVNSGEIRTKQERIFKENWTIELTELETFFASTTLPAGPVVLNECMTVTDCPSFIRSHLATVKANNGNKTFLPHLERLKALKLLFENNKYLQK